MVFEVTVTAAAGLVTVVPVVSVTAAVIVTAAGAYTGYESGGADRRDLTVRRCPDRCRGYVPGRSARVSAGRGKLLGQAGRQGWTGHGDRNGAEIVYLRAPRHGHDELAVRQRRSGS